MKLLEEIKNKINSDRLQYNNDKWEIIIVTGEKNNTKQNCLAVFNIKNSNIEENIFMNQKISIFENDYLLNLENNYPVITMIYLDKLLIFISDKKLRKWKIHNIIL